MSHFKSMISIMIGRVCFVFSVYDEDTASSSEEEPKHPKIKLLKASKLVAYRLHYLLRIYIPLQYE